MDIVIPSLTDPSIAPPGKHVMSCFVQYAPYTLAEGTWDDQREAFGDTVINTLSEYAPNLKDIILSPPGRDAARSRAHVGALRGQHLPGRAVARAAVLPAPGAGVGRLSHANRGPRALRVGDASGRRDHGRAGPQRRALPCSTGKSSEPPGDHRRRPQRPRRARPISPAPGASRWCSSARDEVGGARGDPRARAGLPRAGTGACGRAPRRHRLGPESRRSRGCTSSRPPRQRVRAGRGRPRAGAVARSCCRACSRSRPGRAADAARWPEFSETAVAIAGAIGGLLRQVPPSLDEPGPGELWDLVPRSGAVRGLGRSRLYQMLRWGPMPIADLAAEWLESPVARAVVCASRDLRRRGGSAVGGNRGVVAAAGRARRPSGRRAHVRRRGPGSLAGALAGGRHRRRRRDPPQRGRRPDRCRTTAGVRGVTLATGEQIRAGIVISNADPRRTLARPGRSGAPAAVVPPQDPALPDARRPREGQPGARAPAEVPGAAAHEQPSDTLLAGRIHIGAGSRLSGARVRSIEVRRGLERAVARGDDPVAERSDAGAAGPARDVHLRAVGALCAARTGAGIRPATRLATRSSRRSPRMRPTCRR